MLTLVGTTTAGSLKTASADFWIFERKKQTNVIKYPAEYCIKDFIEFFWQLLKNKHRKSMNTRDTTECLWHEWGFS